MRPGAQHRAAVAVTGSACPMLRAGQETQCPHQWALLHGRKESAPSLFRCALRAGSGRGRGFRVQSQVAGAGHPTRPPPPPLGEPGRGDGAALCLRFPVCALYKDMPFCLQLLRRFK